MDNNISNKSVVSVDEISLSTRENLIKHTSVFSHFGNELLYQLAIAMQEIHFEEGDIIVKEGDLVDSVYLIAKGNVSVSKQVVDDGKNRSTLLAVLSKGDNIGLKEAGLYSNLSMRTATVTANTPSLLLKIPLDTLQTILKNNPQLSSLMQESLESALKLRLITESIQVTNSNNERFAAIAKSVQERSFKEGETIFAKGEVADFCFIIYEGQVEIIQTFLSGEQKKTTFEPGKLIAEDFFVSHGIWNATAFALTPCKILVLKRHHLLELLEDNTEHLGADVMLLLTDKNHPIRAPKVVYQQQTSPDGEVLVTLKNQLDYTYMQLNEQEWFVWLQCNGHLTPSEIAHETCKKFPQLELNDVLMMLQNSLSQGFIFLNSTIKPTIRKKELTQYKQEELLPWLKWVYFLKKPDQLASFMNTYGGSYLVSTPACWCYLLFILWGFIVFPITTPFATKQITNLSLFPLTLLIALSISMLFNLLTPLFKLLAIKKVGHLTPHVGLVWHAIGPSIFVDTSDLLLASKKSRLEVGLITLMANFLVASILSLYAYSIKSTDSVLFYWLCALFLYLNALRTLDPMLNLEGYHLLSESLNLPKLRLAAFNVLKAARSRHPFLHKTMLFWLQELVYIGMNLVLTSWLLSYFVKQWPSLTAFRMLILLLMLAIFILEIFFEWQALKKTQWQIGTNPS